MGGQDSHREEEPVQCSAVRERTEQAGSRRDERGRESQQEPAAMVSKSRAEWRGWGQ